MRSTAMTAFLLALIGTARTSSALPPNAPPDLRPGANHHTGDDGFVAHLGREPRPDEEKLRMHEHFVAVRARLAAKKPTRPELEAMRQKILGYLDEYIAKGTTPDNTHLPWRTPVFIDDQHTICAVGYLIEQTAGRPLAEKIAQEHRYDFIEDIAKAMPEVRAWVESSGFTLDELGQIQPGYPGPDVLLWHLWAGPEGKRDDSLLENGPYEHDDLRGTFRRHKMEGTWVRQTDEAALLGTGHFHHGNGAWTSYYANGTKLAEGSYVDNAPDGAWRFYHESGNLAAEGSFASGQRSGHWRFYYDTQDRTPIAAGRFSSGYVAGTWRHYDMKGALLATSVVDTPAGFHKDDQLFWSIGYLVDIVPTRDHIKHQIHQGSLDGERVRLDALATADGQERLYLRGSGDDVFDADGHKLVPVAMPHSQNGGWRTDDCHWSKARRHAARAGDVSALHGLIFHATNETCDAGARVPRARAQRISTLIHAMDEVRAASPAFLKELALGQEAPEDLTNVIASNMSLDIEWPHVDRRFIQVYETLPGYAHE